MQRRLDLAALLLTACWSSFGCDSESHSLGLGEPIVVHQAELKHGELPGELPQSGDVSDEDKRITSLELRFGVLRPGAPNLAVAGRTTGDAYAVAIRIVELGSGYWLKPVGVEDPTVPGELTISRRTSRCSATGCTSCRACASTRCFAASAARYRRRTTCPPSACTSRTWSPSRVWRCASRRTSA